VSWEEHEMTLGDHKRFQSGGGFFSGRFAYQSGHRKKNSASQQQLELALAVLLVELASSDEGFAQKEYQVIIMALHRVFGVARDRAQRHINEAVTILKNLRSTSKYALRLREHLTSKELTLVARCIDDVMDADGVQDGFEIYHRTRFRELLGIQAVDLDKTVDQDEEEELF
jgi:uncharacterized tellurite resistance protein B-like protein